MFEKCFGCIPRRIGILVWGYINLILSLLWIATSVSQIITGITILETPLTALGIGIFFISPVLNITIILLFIFKVHKILTIAAFVPLVIFMMVTPFTMKFDFLTTAKLEQLLFSFKSFWFTIILLIGCHLKCRSLISLNYYAGLISCVESACTVVADVIGDIMLLVNPPSRWTTSTVVSLSWPNYLRTILVFLINVLLQGYILFLIREEIKKYKLKEQKYVTPTVPLNEHVPMNVQLPEERNLIPHHLEGEKSLYTPINDFNS